MPFVGRRRHHRAAAAKTIFPVAVRAQRSSGRVPQEILDDHREIRRTFLHRVMPAIRHRHEARCTVAAQVDEDVRECGFVEIRQQRRVVRMVAEPVVHDHHAFGARAVLQVAEAVALKTAPAGG
ncbi:hypothetical protein [Burkholderia pyrrocinia]|uniref:hypothetical protein n=1 Tax=Burkholderia pyrrocinia TaxID=60550 RepID=UPI001374D48C|nr:hypothetical protein [Burkholderia pyrrocinia]